MSGSSHANPEADDDVRLFVRARAGDDAAWDELFRRCYPKLLRVIRRKLNHSMPLRPWYDSADFASDVMKSLAAKADRLDFDSPGSLMAFLKQLAEEKLVDQYRHARRHRRDITRQQSLDHASDDGHACLRAGDPTASEVASAREVGERLLAGQGEPEREVIGLRYQGYSLPEIAEQTGWHIRKVQRFFRSLWTSVQDPESQEHEASVPRPAARA